MAAMEEASSVLVVYMVEEGLDEATQETLMAHLRLRSLGCHNLSRLSPRFRFRWSLTLSEVHIIEAQLALCALFVPF